LETKLTPFCIFETKKVLKAILKPQGFLSIKLKKTKSQHLVAQLKINNKEGLFLIDTGASNSCISINKEDYFSIVRQDDELEMSGAGSEKLKAKPSMKSTINYKETFLLNLKFFLLDMNAINSSLSEQGSITIDGIIGADFLKRTNAIIDCKSKNLFLKL
jgi:hypothetical protein